MDLARQTALDILIAWDRNGSYPNILLNEKLDKLTDRKDRSFCTNLVYGTVENKLKLDYFISSVSSIPFSKIHIVNKNILRMGLQQILNMNVPASAACNTSVFLAKKNGQYRSAGFINAILRKLSACDELLLPQDNSVSSRSVRFSIHPSIIELLDKEYSAEFTDSYLSALSDLPLQQTTIAVNTIQSDVSGLIRSLTEQGCEVLDSVNGLLTVNFLRSPAQTDAFKNGWFHVLGKPSYETVTALDVLPGQSVVDCCAAPGGKTFAIAYRMNNTGKIYAIDIHPHKIDQMEADAKRLGINNIEFICSDSEREITALISKADRVLCDVPCSGLGIIGKKPDIRYKDLSDFSLYQTQRNILNNGLKYLKPDGKLVYSTCTINPLENEAIIKNAATVLYSKTFLPQQDKTEGFFLSVLQNNI